jgi:hypothetical protein
MKNVLSYYYNLHLSDIHQIEGIYRFNLNGIEYAFTQYKRNLNEIRELYELSLLLFQNGIMVHQFVLNKENQLITYVNQKPYVLLQIYNNSKQNITINDINNFSFSSSILKLPEKQVNWANLWSDKIDYFEYQVNQFGKKNPLIRESFSYFSGLVENGISLFNILELDYNNYSVSHQRLSSKDTMFEFLNPMNLIIDYKVRDACEFYKEKFLNKQSISNEIKEYLSNKNLNVYEILLFFIRMFYPSFYFDKYEYIINNEEDDYQLKNIIELSDKYEKLLKEIYFYLSKYINMPDIEWIKKT